MENKLKFRKIYSNLRNSKEFQSVQGIHLRELHSIRKSIASQVIQRTFLNIEIFFVDLVSAYQEM